MDSQQWWWLSLGIFAVVVVVVAALLGAILATARRIDEHAAGIWTVGKQIAGDTVSIWMMETAVETLKKLERGMAQVERGIARLKS